MGECFFPSIEGSTPFPGDCLRALRAQSLHLKSSSCVNVSESITFEQEDMLWTQFLDLYNGNTAPLLPHLLHVQPTFLHPLAFSSNAIIFFFH